MSLLSFLFFGMPLFSQNYDSLNVDVYGLEIEGPETSLEAGDTATFLIKVGSVASQVSGAHGFVMEINFSSKAELPGSPLVNCDDSWLIDHSAVASEYTVYPDDNQVVLKAHCTDGIGRGGHGELLRIDVVAGVDVPDASELLAQSSGGLMIIENVDLKTWPHLESTSTSTYGNFQVGPVPCTSSLNVKWEEEIPLKMELYSISGEKVGEFNAQDFQDGQLDLSYLQPGTFILRIHTVGGVVDTKRILKI